MPSKQKWSFNMPDNSIINEKTLKVNSLQSKSLNDFINSSFEITEEEF